MTADIITLHGERVDEAALPFESEGSALTARTTEMAVTTQAEYEEAAELSRNIKGKLDALDTERKAITRPIDEAKRQVMDRFKTIAAPYEAALAAVKQSMAGYIQRIENERREAERKAREEEEARQARLRKEMKAAQKKGNVAALEALRDEAEEAPPPLPVPAPPKAEGVSRRENWTFEIVDKDKIPREYLKVDEQKIRGVVRAMKGDTAIPGVRAYAERSVGVRGVWHE